MGRRFAFVVLAALVALPRARAQPADPAPDIEMEPDDAGSGNGSDVKQTPRPAPPVAGSTAPVGKDPRIAKKWQLAAQQLVQKADYNTRKNKPDDAKAQYENAVTAYEKAIEASDDLSLHYELGLVLEKLGKLDLATVEIRRAAIAKSGVKPDLVKKAAAKYDELTMKVGLVTLTVNTDGATISLNGAALGKTPLAEPLVFMPGTYTFSFAADGYQPKDSQIKVEAGSESERAIELEPIKFVVEPSKNDPDAPLAVAAPTMPSKLPLYVGGGATVVLGAVGVITGIIAVSKHSTYVAAASNKLDREDARSNGKTLAHVTDAMLLTAIGAAGFTAYWYFVKYKPAQRKRTEAPSSAPRDPNAPDISKVDVVPWVQATGGGFSVAGSF